MTKTQPLDKATLDAIGIHGGGTMPEFEDFRLILLYDTESGAIITRSISLRLKGATGPSDDEAVARALTRVAEFNSRFDEKPDEARPRASRGLRLIDPGQLKAIVTRDPRYLEGDWAVDLKTQTPVSLDDTPRERGAS